MTYLVTGRDKKLPDPLNYEANSCMLPVRLGLSSAWLARSFEERTGMEARGVRFISKTG